MDRPLGLGFGSFCALMLAAGGGVHSLADVSVVLLPGEYADFAMHPGSGDVVALDSQESEVVLFRAKDLELGTAKPVRALRVGPQPVSVFYKEFEQKQVFAVVCARDAHMYLINAADFTLMAKVELEQGGAWHVTGSRNKKDAFLYYVSYGNNGQDGATSVVSLRDMKDKGRVLDRSLDCTISASGKVAYRRGPGAPSGFEALIRTDGQRDEKPTFVRLFYDHRQTSPFLPDPFDQFTASGSEIYRWSLKKKVAVLDFTPMVFLTKRPVVMGIREDSSAVTLRAASSNTFRTIGNAVRLDGVEAAKRSRLPRTRRGPGSFPLAKKRRRLFADEARGRVLFASKNHVVLVPIDDFQLPDEPFLLADLQGAEQVTVGKESKFTLVPHDKRVEVVFEELPAGARREGMEIYWTPSLDDVGSTAIRVTLKHADLQRTMSMDVEVIYPRLRLPFRPADLAVDRTGKFAVIWEGPSIGALAQHSPAPSNTYRIAVIDLSTGEIRAERKLTASIHRGLIAGDSFVFYFSFSSTKLDVVRLHDLKSRKSLKIGAPVRRVAFAADRLVVQTRSGFEVYDMESLTLLKRVGNGRFPSSPGKAGFLSPHGLFFRNVLFDFDVHPKLLLSANGLPTLAGAISRIPEELLQPENPSWANPLAPATSPVGQGTERIAVAQIPGSKEQISLDRSLHRLQGPGATHTYKMHYELTIGSTADESHRQVLVRRELRKPGPLKALLGLAAGKAVVVDQHYLYQWKVPGSKNAAASERERLRLIPRQTALSLQESGSTILRHQTTGGTAPLRFSTLSLYDGLELDETSGTLTIDNPAIMKEALAVLERNLVSSWRGGSYIDTYRARATRMADQATLLLGRRPKGAPVAIPIHIEVTDATGASSSMQYYIIAEVPTAAITERLRQLDEQRAKQVARARQQPARRSNPDGSPRSDERDLARRIEALENRVDLLTRELNAVLKQLEKLGKK